MFYTFDDISLVPQYSELKSRSEANTITKIGGYELKNPIISSNMETVTGPDMAIAIWRAGGIGALHRFQTIAQNVHDYKKVTAIGAECLVSVGVNEKCRNRAEHLYEAGARMFVIDVAHGHSVLMKNMLGWMKNKWPDVFVVAGNVATRQAVLDLIDWGADTIKVGIGGGCFAGDTKILMSNGEYRDIKDVNVGEFVINKHGNPVKVINKINSGFKQVRQIKTSNFHKKHYVTSCHRYWMGDCTHVSDGSFSSRGKAKMLDQDNRSGKSKYQWVNVANHNKKTLYLTPKNIDFDCKSFFDIDLCDYTERFYLLENNILQTHSGKKFKRYLRESFELGYIFGTYLGDGDSRILKNGSGVVNWSFGIREKNIANKLVSSLKNVFGIDSKVWKKQGNVLQVTVYSKFLAKLFSSFDKKTKKCLPKEFLCKDQNYVQGLYEGLIDSDGHREKSRQGFTNTSEKIIELFYFTCFVLGKTFCSYQSHKSSGFECKKENLSDSFEVKTHSSNRKTKQYWYSTLSHVSGENVIEIETWDIEVDCPTHSFIANNCIVHNSVCTTRRVTGHGVPMFSCLQECSDLGVPIIADGGIKCSGDMVKSFVAGADLVMVGSLLAGTLETPGKLHTKENGVQYKIYKGSASYDKKGVTKEGIETTVLCKGKTKDVIESLVGGIRSGMSYCNARTLDEISLKAKWIAQSHAGTIEGLPHASLK